MVTKFNTGDTVMVPATIREARDMDGKIMYHVDAPWEVPEEYIEESKTAIMFDAFRKLNDAMPRY